MKLVITNKANGVTSITPFVEEIALAGREVGRDSDVADADGIIVYTLLPSDIEPRAEFLKWDDNLTYELRK